MTTRPLIPRPALAVVPVVVSDEDESCYPVVGVTARRLRELVRALAVPHVKLGRRMLVRVSDLNAALERASATTTETDMTANDGHDAEEATPIGEDAVLAALGRRRIR